jgi:tetratricopeptide (TPR) repeat protein
MDEANPAPVKPPTQRKLAKPAPKRRGLVAALSVAGMLAVLGGGVYAALFIKKKDEQKQPPRHPGPAADPRAARLAAALEAALGRLREAGDLSQRRGDTREQILAATKAAVEKATEAIGLDEKSPSAWYARGKAKWLSGDEDGALADLAKARELDPADAVIRYALARARLERLCVARRFGRPAEDPAPLAAEFRELASLADEHVPANVCRVAEIHLAGEHARAARAVDREEEERRAGEDLYRLLGAVEEARGEPRLAEKAFDKALKERPNYPEGLAGRAKARLAVRELENAEKDAAAALKWSRSKDLLALRGAIRAARRDFRGAVEDFTAADRLVERGECHLAMRKYELAARDAFDARAREPKSIRAMLLDARCLLWQAKVDLGLKILEEAMAADPASPDPWVERAEVRAMLEKFDEALADAAKAVELAPRGARALCGRGEVLRRKGDLEAARQDFLQAKHLDSNEPRAHVGLARVLRDSGDRPGAQIAISAALQLDPRNPEYLVARAGLRPESELPQALRDIDEALKIDENYAEAYSERAIVHLRMGDAERAVRDIQRAVELRPLDRSSLEKILKPPKEPRPPDDK